MIYFPADPLTPGALLPTPAVLRSLPSPAYMISEAALDYDMSLLREVADRAACKMLLAQKAFTMPRAADLVRKYLDGTTASGIFEAKAGHAIGGETHVYSPAYGEEELRELLSFAHTILFNSWREWEHWQPLIRTELAGRPQSERPRFGLRVNPGYSEVETLIYNPCTPLSRLGMTPEAFNLGLSRWDSSIRRGPEPSQCSEQPYIDGLHFHALCQQNADVLERVLERFLNHYGAFLERVNWLNLGGGHHITRPDYDIDLLIRLIERLHKLCPHLEIYLEPGEACALNAGLLLATVLDIDPVSRNVILDTSAACHMPDVLEMPYQPRVWLLDNPAAEATVPGSTLRLSVSVTDRDDLETTYPGCLRAAVDGAERYVLGGPTCLAGDIIGLYEFNRPLVRGDILLFGDMAIYSFVKNNTFNGIPLPALLWLNSDTTVDTIKNFGYRDFIERLG